MRSRRFSLTSSGDFLWDVPRKTSWPEPNQGSSPDADVQRNKRSNSSRSINCRSERIE
jgi:hypothetical protein